jgi:hypothetical protein
LKKVILAKYKDVDDSGIIATTTFNKKTNPQYPYTIQYSINLVKPMSNIVSVLGLPNKRLKNSAELTNYIKILKYEEQKVFKNFKS